MKLADLYYELAVFSLVWTLCAIQSLAFGSILQGTLNARHVIGQTSPVLEAGLETTIAGSAQKM